MRANPLLTGRESCVVTLLSRGRTPKQVAEELHIVSAARLISNAKHKAGVRSRRALVYASLAREWILRPALVDSPAEVDEVSEYVWAGLRFDVRDEKLRPLLASHAQITQRRVKEILLALKDQYHVNLCGLISVGYAHGVLSGREGHRVPALPLSRNRFSSTRAAPGETGTGIPVRPRTGGVT